MTWIDALQEGIQPSSLVFAPAIALTDEQLYAFCQQNPAWRIERTTGGEIVIMPPVGGASSHRNLSLSAALYAWTLANPAGVAFDSSVGFLLPNGALRSPDASWVRRERLANLTPVQKQRFLPLCPDFVVELRSPSDRLADLQAKMEEYQANGAQLGWLIDPLERQVWVYTAGRTPTRLIAPATLPGDPVLPGFSLSLAPIWSPTL